MADKFYPIVVMPLSEDDGGGYAAYVPDLYGCFSDGETPEEAIENVKDAISEWCDEMKRLGREIPEPGSAAKQKHEEWASLISLIEEQDRALKDQDEIIGRLHKEVAQIKERVRHIMEIESETPESLTGVWSAKPYVPADALRTFVSVRDSDPAN